MVVLFRVHNRLAWSVSFRRLIIPRFTRNLLDVVLRYHQHTAHSTAPVLLGPTFWPQVYRPPGTSRATELGVRTGAAVLVVRIQAFYGGVGHGLDSRVMAYGVLVY